MLKSRQWYWHFDLYSFCFYFLSVTKFTLHLSFTYNYTARSSGIECLTSQSLHTSVPSPTFITILIHTCRLRRILTRRYLGQDATDCHEMSVVVSLSPMSLQFASYICFFILFSALFLHVWTSGAYPFLFWHLNSYKFHILDAVCEHNIWISTAFTLLSSSIQHTQLPYYAYILCYLDIWKQKSWVILSFTVWIIDVQPKALNVER